MKKIISLLLALCCIVSLAACSKNTDNLPTLSSISEMEEATVNELLKGYHRDQLIEVWGEPTNSSDNEAIWITDDITLTVNINNNGEVVICGLNKDTPSIAGVVTEVYENSFLMLGEPTEGYPNAEEYRVSLNVENEGSYTSVAVGDEVIVYHNGEIAESDPLQINTVYAITLKTPAAENTDIAISKELPGLKIAYGEEEITAWVGSHSWIYEDEKGEMNAITADSNHPLHCMETMSFIPVWSTTISHAVGHEPGQVTLNFDVEPTKITVYRYDVKAADETAGEEIIMDNGYVLDLAFGNYLYHIAAEWDYPDNELGGSGDYAFYTKAPEIYNP